jgi:hypothetical protein
MVLIVCLKKYSSGTRDGQIVLVQHTSIQDADYGSGYTIKEYSSKKDINDEAWSHQSITLRPLSNNSEFKSIELRDDEISSLKVIGVFVDILE